MKELHFNNLKDVPAGTYATANIQGITCSGRIQQEGGLTFFCQNELDGKDCIDKLGYRYSFETNKDYQNLQFWDQEVKLIKETKKFPFYSLSVTHSDTSSLSITADPETINKINRFILGV